MKLEKISDNQIRCTLSKRDLADRHILISELAYGSENAQALFRDMLQQAHNEFGFELNDIPLMIEAIPASSDCLILLITKVSDPDELDSRFSDFSPSTDVEDSQISTGLNIIDDDNFDEDDIDIEVDVDNTTTGDIIERKEFRGLKSFLDFMNQMTDDVISVSKNGGEFLPLSEIINNSKNSNKKAPAKTPIKPEIYEQIYAFNSIDEAIDACLNIGTENNLPSSFYKDAKNEKYYLSISKGKNSAESFKKVCNMMLEYSTKINFNYATIAYFNEHLDIIIKDKAIKILSSI